MRCSGVAVVVWAGLGGCLPEGGPGLGRQVVAERGLADVAFSREARDGPGGYLLFTRASASGGVAETGDALERDLYVVARDGGPSQLRAERLPAQVRSLYFWDDRGRLYLHRDVQRKPAAGPGMPAAVSWELLGLDPLAGGEVSMGRTRLERLSPSRTRLFYQRPDGAGFVRTLADGGERAVGPGIRQSMFIDEDLYFVDQDGLGRLAAGRDAPEPLLPEVSAFRPVTTPLGDLVVRRPVPDSKEETLALVRLSAEGAVVSDASQLTRGRLIGDPFVSPDGGRVAWVGAGDAPETIHMTIWDLASGHIAQAGLPAPMPRRSPSTGAALPYAVEAAYRPGSQEVWFALDSNLTVMGPGTIRQVIRPIITGARIGPGRSADRVADDRPASGRRARSALFTGDGRRWIFQGSDARARLGSADDPEADQGIAVGTIGSSNDLLELERGRRLAVWLLPGTDRADLYVLDVERDDLRFVARDVGATLFGARRVLAIARKVGDRRATGDLVLVDLQSAAETLLAQNVSEFAVPACAGCDPTAPGAPFAYVVQARVPWRHEGLWTGELP